MSHTQKKNNEMILKKNLDYYLSNSIILLFKV